VTRHIRVTRLGSRPNRIGYLPFSQSTAWRLIKNDPTFPKPFALSLRVSVVDADAVDAWLDTKRQGGGRD
jgi:predicted DNA-binding transcriptional regulator AlpA